MSQPESTLASFRAASRHALQERVSAAILDAAARVLAGRGEQASMNDVAAAAGVARATVYRYFPSRQALLDELARLAVRDAAERLASARIDEVPAEEGVRRAIRALVDVGDYFVVLAREQVRPDEEQFEEGVAAPLRRLFERGAAAGQIRQDIPSPWLTNSLVGLVVSVLTSTPAVGKEDTIAAITGLVFDGMRARGSHRRRS
ncbi:MAG: TetR/AcrR family transcriptional regulator [Actinomycetota bacterium]|nr:TetR/AcrR family transcriptional regulator [Actinomycetota bacterium]